MAQDKKKYRVYIPANAGASYEVEAIDEQDAFDQASKQAKLTDCVAHDWDQYAEADVERLEDSNA